MLLSVLPDVDIILGLAGIDLGHRTLTHSIIIWSIVGGAIVFLISLKYKRGSEAAIYLIAYMSHLVIGDIIVENINIFYPIGDVTIYSTIESGSLQHISLEAILVGLMATVVITMFKHRKKNSCRFGYRATADSFLYLLLILAIPISAIYIIIEFQFSLVYVSILVILHSAAIATIILMWIVSKGTKGTKRQQHLVSS
jgi:membrane-bound metal-dependent hydrolase YbcI (DUF457 family)